MTYIDDPERLIDGALNVKGEPSVDFGRHFSRNFGEDLRAEQNQEMVQCSIDFFVDVVALRRERGERGS